MREVLAVDEQITAVHQETRLAVEAVRRITGTLASIAEVQDTIATVVEQRRDGRPGAGAAAAGMPHHGLTARHGRRRRHHVGDR